MELTLKSFANPIWIWESHIQSFWEQELVWISLVSARTQQENSLFTIYPLQLIVKTASKILYFLLTLWSHAVVREESSSVTHYSLLKVPLFCQILKTPSKIQTVSIVHSYIYIFKDLQTINILERILLAYPTQTFRTCLQ